MRAKDTKYCDLHVISCLTSINISVGFILKFYRLKPLDNSQSYRAKPLALKPYIQSYSFSIV